MEVELRWCETGKVWVFYKPSGLRPIIILYKMRQCPVPEAKWDSFSFNVLLSHTSNDLLDITQHQNQNHIYKWLWIQWSKPNLCNGIILLWTRKIVIFSDAMSWKWQVNVPTACKHNLLFDTVNHKKTTETGKDLRNVDLWSLRSSNDHSLEVIELWKWFLGCTSSFVTGIVQDLVHLQTTNK